MQAQGVSVANSYVKEQIPLGKKSFWKKLDILLEMGPAPPSAASQIMISYSLDPPAVEEVNMS